MHLSIMFCIGFSVILSGIVGDAPVFSDKEKAAIAKLRNEVGNKLTAHYMTSDAYLIKWLKAKNFDHKKSKEALEKTLQWRAEINADNLPFEDNSHLVEKYVIDFKTTRDTLGRPVALMPFGEWDLRKKTVEGKLPELNRRLDYMEENTAQLAYNLTGDPTGMLVADLAGFNARQHACVGCVPFYLGWVRHHEIHYPYNFYKVLCINTPAIFDPILSLMRPLMTASTKEAFRTMGHNREEWSKFIHETVSPDQLPYRFGGTKKKLTKQQPS